MTMGSCSASRGSTSIPPGCGNWGLRVEHQDTNPELTLTGHDELTELIGRGALFKQLQARIDAGALPISVIFLELDHFSVFNDSLGYPAGDEMLRVVARRLAVEVPQGAIVARFDGDQFVVAVCADLANGVRLARHLAERISAKIEAERLSGLHVTCSVGVSVAESASDAMEVVQRADLALCQAKRGGRNRVCPYDEVFAASRLRQQRLVVELERALEGAIDRLLAARGGFVEHALHLFVAGISRFLQTLEASKAGQTFVMNDLSALLPALHARGTKPSTIEPGET